MPYVDVLIEQGLTGAKERRKVLCDSYGTDDLELLAVHKLIENPTCYGISHMPTGWRLFWYTEQWRAKGAAAEACRHMVKRRIWQSESVEEIQQWGRDKRRGAKDVARLNEIFTRWRNAATATEAEEGAT